MIRGQEEGDEGVSQEDSAERAFERQEIQHYTSARAGEGG
jgi:hypothetical protein